MTGSLPLPGIPPALADELWLDGPPSASATVLREAIAVYDRATRDWFAARELADIVPLDPDDERDAADLAVGVKYKAATVEGARLLAGWQRARAELRAAVANRRAELARGRR